MVLVRTLLYFAALPILLHAETPCATCHAQIAATYARTGMARSFYRTPQVLPTAQPYIHQLSATGYEMVQRDGAWYQRRWRIAPDGKPAYLQESRVDYVMGSGNHVSKLSAPHRTRAR